MTLLFDLRCYIVIWPQMWHCYTTPDVTLSYDLRCDTIIWPWMWHCYDLRFGIVIRTWMGLCHITSDVTATRCPWVRHHYITGWDTVIWHKMWHSYMTFDIHVTLNDRWCNTVIWPGISNVIWPWMWQCYMTLYNTIMTLDVTIVWLRWMWQYFDRTHLFWPKRSP